MRHETYLPTQQTETQEEIWIPRPHENCGRPESDQTPPQSRTKVSGSRIRYTFPSSLRLRQRRDFQRVARDGQRLVGQLLCLDFRRAPFQKLGITASNKYGSSPERNRFKRIVREAFRLSRSRLPILEINVIPRSRAKSASLADIQGELLKLLSC